MIKNVKVMGVVTEFVAYFVPYLNSNEDVLSLNFVFPNTVYSLFKYVQENYLCCSGIRDEDIAYFMRAHPSQEDIPNIVVKDPILFFENLTKIIEVAKVAFGMEIDITPFLYTIFLRMGPNDFTNVEKFLERQVEFLLSRTFDEYKDDYKNDFPYNKVGEFEEYCIVVQKDFNPYYFETDYKMNFVLCDDSTVEHHTLPSIHFGVCVEDGEEVCYIYGIQNLADRVRNKRLERSLYKINKGIENPVVHPSQVLVLKTFIEMLRERGITKIKVPAMQVLSYPNHVLMNQANKKVYDGWLEYLSTMLCDPEKYKDDLELFQKVKAQYEKSFGKEEFIEKAKTEGLYNIFYRVAEQFGEIEILNEPFVEDEYLHVRIKREKVFSKSRMN